MLTVCLYVSNFWRPEPILIMAPEPVTTANFINLFVSACISLSLPGSCVVTSYRCNKHTLNNRTLVEHVVLHAAKETTRKTKT
jgi:hypothetical protein